MCGRGGGASPISLTYTTAQWQSSGSSWVHLCSTATAGVCGGGCKEHAAICRQQLCGCPGELQSVCVRGEGGEKWGGLAGRVSCSLCVTRNMRQYADGSFGGVLVSPFVP